jgi:hypothetical protein
LAEVVSQSFTLVISGPSGFAGWIDSQPITKKGFAQDGDDDGVENGLEYYFGTSVSTAAHASPLPVVSPNGTQITWWRDLDATDVTGTVEWSRTLAPNSWSSIGVTYEVLSTQGNRQQVRATAPGAGESLFFMRLNVSL